MKTWVIARGPDKAKVLGEAEALAETLRAGDGVVLRGDAGDMHIDSLPDRSVSIIVLQDSENCVHVIDERVTQFMILAVGLDSGAQAVRLSQGMQELGAVAVLSKEGVRLFPKDTTLDKCRTVIIDYPTHDAEIRSIGFDSETYFGFMSSKKLSGKRLLT